MEQSQLVELAAAWEQDHGLVSPPEMIQFWPAAPAAPTKGAGPRPGGAGPRAWETPLQGSEPVHSKSVQSPDHGRA